MKMIRHEEHKTAVPHELLVIMGCCSKDGLARTSTAKVIKPTRGTINGNRKKITFRDPYRDFVRQSATLRPVHESKLKMIGT